MTATASASSATTTSTTPLGACIAIGPTSSGWTSPSPPPAIIAGPPMPIEASSVATIRSEQPAITALPAKQRPLTTAMRGTTPDSPAQSANARTSQRRDDGVVGVAGPAAAALGEEHRRQPHALDQFEQPVLLAVPVRALGAREHRVVVGQHRAGAALVAEQVAVDARRARHQPSAGVRAIRSSSRGGGAGRRSRSARTPRTSRGRPGRRCSPGPCARPGAPALDRLRPGRRPRSAPGAAAARRGRRGSPHQTWRGDANNV